MIAAVLPGVIVAAVFAGLLVAMRRWFDPVPALSAAVSAGVLLLLFGKALFLGGVLLPLDLLRDTPPWKDLPPVSPTSLTLQWDLVQDFAGAAAEHRRLVQRGEWPLINRNAGAGEPFLANLQAQHLHPFTLLGDLVDEPAAPGLTAALKVLTCLVFFGALLRRCGLGEGSALGGALAYALSGFVMLWLGWPHTHSAAMLPVLCYALSRIWPEARRRDLLLFAIAVALLILGGHPETIVYAAAGAGIFAATIWLPRMRGLALRDALRPVLATAGAGALALCVTAPALLPFLLQLGTSERTVANRWRVEAIRSGRAEHPATLELIEQRALPIVAPLAFGSERYGESWGFASIIQEGASFAGTAVVLLALLWLPLRARGARFPGETAAAAMAAIGLLFVIQPPGLVRLMVELPVLAQSGSENRRLALFVCFGFSFLAACTWERALRLRSRTWIPVAAGTALAAFLVWAYRSNPHPTVPWAQEQARTAALHLQVGIAAALGLLLTGLSRSKRLAAGPGLVAFVFPLLAFLELFQLHGVFSPAMPRSHYFPARPTIGLLQEELGDGRMVGYDGAYLDSYPLVSGLADLRSSSPLQPWSLMRLTRRLRLGVLSREFGTADDPILDLLGVSHVVAADDVELAPPLERIHAGDGLAVWRRPRAMNLVFLARRAIVESGDWAQPVGAIADFHHTTLVDTPPPSGERHWRARTPRRDRVLELDSAPAHVRAIVDTTEAVLLATSLYQDGGWSVLVDGAKIAAVNTNGIFVGAWLPPGRHRVDLVYRPPGFVLGALVGGLALLAGGAWWHAAGTAPRPRA